MDFNDHSRLDGLHAFLSPSKYHWINYDDQKLDATFIAAMAARRGDALHAYANTAIRLGRKQPANRDSLNSYVNDAIGFRMTSEQPLYYSDNAFGTCDAICFRKGKLRIHDLKTGISPTSMRQLEVYAALFCLEYGHNPEDIAIELRIYQRDEVIVHDPDPAHIRHIMDKIVAFDRRIQELRREVL